MENPNKVGKLITHIPDLIGPQKQKSEFQLFLELVRLGALDIAFKAGIGQGINNYCELMALKLTLQLAQEYGVT